MTNVSSEFLYSAFKDPDQYYDLWVYGLGWMHVYFQVGMIIGDMEQHNKICGFCGGNGLHRRHMSRDCNVISDDADNSNIKCTRKKQKETCRFIVWLMTTSELNGNVMPSIPAHYKGTKQSSKSRSKSKSTPDDWCRLISQNHRMPALFDHDFGGNREGVLGACPFEVLHIISFSLDY